MILRNCERWFSKVGFLLIRILHAARSRIAEVSQIMQTLCLEAFALRVGQPLESTAVSEALLAEIKKRTLRSYNHKTASIFAARPSDTRSERLAYRFKNGSQGDVYECLIAALRLDPLSFNWVGSPS